MANRSTLSLLAALAVIALVQPVLSARVAPAGRSLLLATGNCPTKIAGCDVDRCGTKQVDGVSASVCERCRLGYIRTNNGLQCVCPPGTWQSGSGATAACVPCEKAFYCPGGDRLARNSAPADKIGVRIACDASVTASSAVTANVEALGMTTKSPRAKRYTDCVPIAGYYLVVATRAAQKAAKCDTNTYSPGFSRLRACFKCQSGLVEPAYLADLVASGALLRTDKSQVCGVPKGRYLSQNVVRDCPAGTFRSTWELVTDTNARYCFPCPIGITTPGAASTSFGACKVALPGYQINFAQNVAAMEATIGTDANATLQNPATDSPPPCPIGSYFPGGVIYSNTTATCTLCPLGTTTQGTGSSAVEDCMVPPGYFIKTSTASDGSLSGTLTKCPTNATTTVNGAVIRTGFYRDGWKSQLDTTLQSATDGTDGACTPCGENILSLYTDIDELGTGDNTANLVAASAASCYIEAGWGMTPVALQFNSWRANLCTANSYGVETRTFGLVQSPCKPCQRFMITLRAGATNYTECINPAGFGFTSDGVSQCPKGFYTALGSMAPCTACPSGRTTDFNDAQPSLQDDITDCYVDAGNGIFNPATVTNTSTDVELPVLPCPAGTYSSGGSISTTCTPCTNGYTTIDEGTIGSDNSACTVCSAGYGQTGLVTSFPAAGACGSCPYSTYQAGFTGIAGLNVVGDGKSCHSCAKTNFTYVGSSGRKARYTSDGITFYTKSRGPEACVPRYSQLMIDAGQTYSLPADGWTSITGSSVQACLDICAAVTANTAGKACFAQADYTGDATEAASCKTITLDLASSTAPTAILIKMMPSDPIAAASVKDDQASTKAMASGLYSRVQIPAAWTTTANTAKIGQQLATGTSEADCRQKCDQNSRCWGVLLADTCSLRTGEDSLDSRSFFYNPDPTIVATAFETLKW